MQRQISANIFNDDQYSKITLHSPITQAPGELESWVCVW